MPTDNLINEDRFSFSPSSFNKIFVFRDRGSGAGEGGGS